MGRPAKAPEEKVQKSPVLIVTHETYNAVKNSALMNNRSLAQETDAIISDHFNLKRKEVNHQIAEDTENNKLISYLKDFHSPSWKRWIPVIDELIASADNEMPVEVFHIKCKYLGPISTDELFFLIDRLQYLYDGQIKYNVHTKKLIKTRPVKYKLSNIVWNYHVLRGTGATTEEICAAIKCLLRVGSNLPVYSYSKSADQ